MKTVDSRDAIPRRLFFGLLFCAAVSTAISCASRATSTYPSYEQTVARYSPPGSADGVPLAEQVCAGPGECECPRVWYRDHWVYNCDGRWVFWNHGYWYHYPHFHLYYYEGAPRVYNGTTRSIKKR